MVTSAWTLDFALFVFFKNHLKDSSYVYIRTELGA